MFIQGETHPASSTSADTVGQANHEQRVAHENSCFDHLDSRRGDADFCIRNALVRHTAAAKSGIKDLATLGGSLTE